MDRYLKLPKSFENSTFLLDANFFIDAYSKTEDFKELVSSLKKARIEFVSTSFVKYEFTRSKTIDVVRRKEKYFDKLVGVILPLDKEVEKHVIGIIEEYKQYMERLPLTDLMLAAYLRRYHRLYHTK